MNKDLNNQCGCTSPFILNPDNTDCICPENSILESGSCVCKSRFYNNSLNNSLQCQACPDYC